MGAFRLFVSVASAVASKPELLTDRSLEELASLYEPYAYIGSRHTLREGVFRDAVRIAQCAKERGDTLEDAVAWWYGTRKWRIDSGAFPDFVMAWEGTGAVGDGALVELKDSRSGAIASFNSTLPSSHKKLEALTELVKDAVRRYETCLQGREGPEERECFYLVRTHRAKPQLCRLSLVQGSFFETLPTSELLTSLWEQVLEQAKVPPKLRGAIISYLSQLGREDIAQTRQIARASIKPRLRIMSEIVREGNPHAYPELTPRSINLILKLPEELVRCPTEQDRAQRSWAWIEDQCQKESIAPLQASEFALKLVQHRRNGLHLVLQKAV